ncbi:MAG: ATP-binding protein [Cyanophyceae cyanobacterium]
MSHCVTKILLIEDDREDVDLIEEYLERSPQFPMTLKNITTLTEGISTLKSSQIDLVLTDLTLPDQQGLNTFRLLHDQFPTIPVIILSGLDDEDLAVAAMQEGAQDYLVKGHFNSHLLIRSIRYALERQQLVLDLDRRVEQRTAELQKANQDLQAKDVELREALLTEKKLNQLKSQIITTISHEYRTPLAVISSSSGLLRQYRHRLDEQGQMKHLERIQRAVEHMTSLIGDVMFISQAECEKIQFNPQPVDLTAFVEDIIDEFNVDLSCQCCLKLTSQRPPRSRTQGSFQKPGPPSLPAQQAFWVDQKLLRQILTNLITNAIKYSPDGGTVSVSLLCEAEQMICKVADEGIGIPPEDQPYLFESFHRASNVDTIPGTGLGLAIVKKGVELHRGQITLESQVGKGTTFIVRLPNHAPTAMAEVSSPQSAVRTLTGFPATCLS